MKTIRSITILLAVLPLLANAEMSMKKPADAAPAAEQAIKDAAPAASEAKSLTGNAGTKKFVSTNAGAIEEKHSTEVAKPEEAKE
jgi:hypothetical protein